MKKLGMAAIVASVFTITGCSMTNGDPSSTEGTIKKWDTVDNAAFTAARSNWQYRVLEVKRTDNDQLMYTFDLSEKLKIFGEMYIRLPAGQYSVKTQCFLSVPNQVNDVRVRTHTHTLDVKPHTKTRFSVDVSGGSCMSKPYANIM